MEWQRKHGKLSFQFNDLILFVERSSCNKPIIISKSIKHLKRAINENVDYTAYIMPRGRPVILWIGSKERPMQVSFLLLHSTVDLKISQASKHRGMRVGLRRLWGNASLGLSLSRGSLLTSCKWVREEERLSNDSEPRMVIFGLQSHEKVHFWVSPRKRNDNTKLHEEIKNSSSDILRFTILPYYSQAPVYECWNNARAAPK